MVEINQEQIDELLTGYSKIVIDVGTGDGTYVYKNGRENKDIFYIGIDPVAENMIEVAIKLKKKPAKGGLDNVLLVVASIEMIPIELAGKADKISVNFPWGSLLEGSVKAQSLIIKNLSSLGKENSEFILHTTLSDNIEEGEINRRNLPELSIEYFNGEYREEMKKNGIVINSVELLGNNDFKSFHSQWAKRLAFGRTRSVFRIRGNCILLK